MDKKYYLKCLFVREAREKNSKMLQVIDVSDSPDNNLSSATDCINESNTASSNHTPIGEYAC